jgi:hypothetical protein
MSMKIFPQVLFLLIVAFVCTTQAQTTATIVGTVQDPAGAVVADAKVTATNQATGLERTVVTDENGNYILTALPIGSYRVRCEKQGFKAAVQENVVLQIAQEVRLNMSLTIGQTNEEVTITSGVTLVNTENAELGEVIDNKRIVDLPLNGRQFMQLAELTPGISRGPTGGFRGGMTGTLTGPNITVNGARDTDNYYTIDGVTANDRFFNSLTVSPSIDAIQEFKVQSNLYSAESGVTGGAQINIAIKSGSNDWHGSVFEFFRNDRLNARNFFDLADNNRDGKLDRPVYQQNQFGFTFGGPLVKDRLFFFGNGEWLRLRVPQSRALTVPTAKMRAGDFSEFGDGNTATTGDVDLRNPFVTGRPAFAGNIVPQAVWNATARDALNLLPLPTRAGTSQNFTAAPAFRNRTDQYNGRIDYRLSSNDTIYGRYIHSDIEAYSPFGAITQGTRGGAALPGYGWDLTTDNRNLAVNYTRVWTQRLISEARFGYNKVGGGQVHENVGNDFAIRNKIQGLFATADNDRGIPRISITGLSPFGDEPNTIVRNNEDFQYDFSVSYNVGAHQMKYGGTLMQVNFAPEYQNITRGNYSFGGSTISSGLGFADFLLGLPTGASTGALAKADFTGREYYFFAQDNWKIKPRFTFTYGVRYEYSQPLVDRNLTVGNFDLRTRTIIVPYDGERTAPAAAFRVGSLTTPFSPIAAGSPNWPVRSAATLGIHPGLIRRDLNNWAPRIGLAWNVFGDEKLVLRTGYGIYYNRKEMFGASTMVQRPPFGYSNTINPPTQACLSPTGAPAPCTATTPKLQIENALATVAPFAFLLPVDPDMRTGYLQQWNFTAQTNFKKSWLFEAGYVGSKGSKLYFIDSRNYRPPNPTPLANSTREFAPYTFGMVVWSDHGFSNYHALQTRLVRRLTAGWQLSGNYTWAHSIDNNSAGSSGSNDSDSGGVSNPFNRTLEKGRSSFDARHRFVVSTVYQLPFGASLNGAAKQLAHGWQLGLIGSWRSGNPFTVDSNFDFGNIGRASANRPDLAGDPNAGPKTATQWFNTRAFVNPVRGVFGKAGRNIVLGDTLTSVDFSVLKDFAVTEKLKVQFRAELFNIGNHTNFGTPNRTYTPVAAGYTAGVSANTNPDFGRVFGAGDPRVAQFALKIVF